MSLPVSLPANTVSIYGYSSLQSISADVNKYQFGVIDQMYFGAQVDLTGQSVMFKLDNSIRVNHSNSAYFLIPEQDIIFTENEEEPEA